MTTDDKDIILTSWYGGRIKLLQPQDGLKATTDAILIAAAVSASSRRIIELGAGTGAASLALACRCPGMHITAVERDERLSGLLLRTIEENNLKDRLTAITADIRDEETLAPLAGRFDHVFFNPPYNDEASSLPHSPGRRAAMAGDDIPGWIAAACRLIPDRGSVTLISRTGRLTAVLGGFDDASLGDVVIRPVHARPAQPAIRILATARKGITGPLTTLAPLILQDEAGAPSDEAEAVSRGGAAILLVAPGRRMRAPRLPE